MPSLSDSMQADLSGYTRVEPVAVSDFPRAPASPTNLDPGYSTFIRCPLPPIWSATPDSLRQFYRNTNVPQNRLFNPTPAPIVTGGVSSVTSIGVISTTGGGSSSGGSSTIVTQASVKTPSVGPGNRFTGTINMSRVFQLIAVTSSSPCRIELYGTALAQSGDMGRQLDTPPPAGSTQNIITDVVLDTAPLAWTFQDRGGANADIPQTNTVYISVTNLDVTSDIITVTITYAALVA